MEDNVTLLVKLLHHFEPFLHCRLPQTQTHLFIHNWSTNLRVLFENEGKAFFYAEDHTLVYWVASNKLNELVEGVFESGQVFVNDSQPEIDENQEGDDQIVEGIFL